MSGPKRNPDRLNTIGVVVVGVCTAVLVYVTIVALQAFYMDDTSEIQMMADYGGQDTQAKTLRTSQMGNLKAPSQPNARAGAMPQTYRIGIKHAMKYVLEEAPKDPANLVPILGRSEKATSEAGPGRSKPLVAPTPPQTPPVDPTGPGSGSATPGNGSATPGSGSATPGTGSATPGAPKDPPTQPTGGGRVNPAGGPIPKGNAH